MAKVKLTAGRIADFKCDVGKLQAFLWCAEVPGLGVRATAGSNRKRYIFQAKVERKSMRVTVGDVSVWGIDAAQVEARRLQTLIDQGNDPRKVKADNAAAKEAARLAKESDAAALAEKNKLESATVSD
ncbi:MAG: integrase arm-type DNA-binding domain-containing protein, partial [Candidatus Nitrotoga sp.]